MGRDWLKHFVLDWGHIKTILRENNTLQELLFEFDVFRDELGTITPMEAKLVVPSTVTPRFHHPRPVPCALRPQVEQELDRLERVGVVERADHSDWAAPVVTVPKKDGQVRICGDYRVTINPVVEIDQYPLPRPEYFSTLDLSHAYNQILLDEDSRQYLVINTHRGLYRYIRLPCIRLSLLKSIPSLFT